MTATRKFIEDAIKGGWSKIAGLKDIHIFFYEADRYVPRAHWNITGKVREMPCMMSGDVPGTYWEVDRIEPVTEEVLLDPLAWQAVGKTRGWKSVSGDYYDERSWEENWHRFIDHLADGKAIDEALQALE